MLLVFYNFVITKICCIFSLVITIGSHTTVAFLVEVYGKNFPSQCATA